MISGFTMELLMLDRMARFAGHHIGFCNPKTRGGFEVPKILVAFALWNFKSEKPH
jgi:hypothetical protein